MCVRVRERERALLSRLWWHNIDFVSLPFICTFPFALFFVSFSLSAVEVLSNILDPIVNNWTSLPSDHSQFYQIAVIMHTWDTSKWFASQCLFQHNKALSSLSSSFFECVVPHLPLPLSLSVCLYRSYSSLWHTPSPTFFCGVCSGPIPPLIFWPLCLPLAPPLPFFLRACLLLLL